MSRYTLLICSIILLLFGCIKYRDNIQTSKFTDNSRIEDVFPLLFRSEHFETKITSIIMVGEFKETNLIQDLAKLLPHAKGIERIAILYVLAKSNSKYDEQFIDSIPTDKNGIIELLDVESEDKSYFNSPFFRIINYLKLLMYRSDKAFEKAVAIHQFADGWQGDFISGYIDEVKEYRRKKEKE